MYKKVPLIRNIYFTMLENSSLVEIIGTFIKSTISTYMYKYRSLQEVSSEVDFN